MLYLRQRIWWKVLRIQVALGLNPGSVTHVYNVTEPVSVCAGYSLLPLQTILCPSLCPEGLTHASPGPPCWLAAGWVQSMVGNGKRRRSRGEVFLILCLQCHILMVRAPTHNYSFHQTASSSWLQLPLGLVTTSCSFPALPIRLRDGDGCSLFLVPGCLPILSWFLYPCLFLYNISQFEKYFCWI